MICYFGLNPRFITELYPKVCTGDPNPLAPARNFEPEGRRLPCPLLITISAAGKSCDGVGVGAISRDEIRVAHRSDFVTDPNGGG
jgi:hypothetical protein